MHICSYSTLIRGIGFIQDELDPRALVRDKEGFIPALRAQITRTAALLEHLPENVRTGIAVELDIARSVVVRASRLR